MKLIFFFSSRRRHTRSLRDWSSDVCSSDLIFHGYYMQILGHPAGNRFYFTHNPSPICRPKALVQAFHRMTRYRSEERRVGKECGSRWSRYDEIEKGVSARGEEVDGRRRQ